MVKQGCHQQLVAGSRRLSPATLTKIAGYFTQEMTLKVQIPNKSDQQIPILDRKCKVKNLISELRAFLPRKAMTKQASNIPLFRRSPRCSPSIVTRAAVNFFTVVSKMPKGNVQHFWHFNSITSLAKRIIFSAQDNFQESH